MNSQKTCLPWNLYELIRAVGQKNSGSGFQAGLQLQVAAVCYLLQLQTAGSPEGTKKGCGHKVFSAKINSTTQLTP